MSAHSNNSIYTTKHTYRENTNTHQYPKSDLHPQFECVSGQRQHSSPLVTQTI